MSHSSNRGPDILDYIGKLNQIPSESDDQSLAVDQFNLEKNLAMFSNAQFFDFDLGHDADLQSSLFEPTTDLSNPLHDLDYSFAKYGTFPSSFEPHDLSSENLSETSTNTPLASCSTIIPQMNCSDNFAARSQMTNASSPHSVGTEITETSRQVAEEDKRRRNTAASARFRVKKKQREQALEKSAKEMSNKVAKFEDRIRMLETENKWLKDLILAKNGDRTINTPLDLESFWTHQVSQESQTGERSNRLRNENSS